MITSSKIKSNIGFYISSSTLLLYNLIAKNLFKVYNYKNQNKSNDISIKSALKDLKEHGICCPGERLLLENTNEEDIRKLYKGFENMKQHNKNKGLFTNEGNKELALACMNLIPYEIDSILKLHFKSNYKILRIDLTKTLPNKDTQREGSFLWHLDNYHKNSYIKLFIYLNDVIKDNGAFQYISKSKTKDYLKAGFNPSGEGRKRITKEMQESMALNSKAFEGAKGTFFLCQTANVIHRASQPIKDKRYLISIELSPSVDRNKITYKGQRTSKNNLYYKFLKLSKTSHAEA